MQRPVKRILRARKESFTCAFDAQHLRFVRQIGNVGKIQGQTAINSGSGTCFISFTCLTPN